MVGEILIDSIKVLDMLLWQEGCKVKLSGIQPGVPFLYEPNIVLGERYPYRWESGGRMGDGRICIFRVGDKDDVRFVDSETLVVLLPMEVR